APEPDGAGERVAREVRERTHLALPRERPDETREGAGPPRGAVAGPAPRQLDPAPPTGVLGRQAVRVETRPPDGQAHGVTVRDHRLGHVDDARRHTPRPQVILRDRDLLVETTGEHGRAPDGAVRARAEDPGRR